MCFAVIRIDFKAGKGIWFHFLDSWLSFSVFALIVEIYPLRF